MVAFTLFFHYNLPPPEVTMVPHAVGVDDDIIEVCIGLHCRGEDGGDKISLRWTKFRYTGRRKKGQSGGLIPMEVHVSCKTRYL